jgi:glycine dehydrogenase subunit 2
LSEPSTTKQPAAEPKLLFESGSPGRTACFWPEEELVSDAIPAALLRREIAGFPELGELETLRHFTRL